MDNVKNYNETPSNAILVDIDANDSNGRASCVTSRASMAVMDEGSTLPHESIPGGTATRHTENHGSNHRLRNKEKKKQSPVQITPILVDVYSNDSDDYSGCLSSRDSMVMMTKRLQRRWCHTGIDSTSASTLAIRPKVGAGATAA
jgi:hypothetical protein